ncbi:MAG: phytanoyl-CoA dioxygenase family protein [Pseudomonadota bacterium]
MLKKRNLPSIPTYLSETVDLQDQDVSEFREQGFLLREFPFSDDDLAIAAEATNEVGALGHVRAQDLWRRIPAVRRLATEPTLLNLLSRLHGRRAFPFQTLNFAVGSQQRPHADTFHFSSEPGHFMAGVWIALEDVSPEAGPLVYYPKSHLLPLLSIDDLDGDDYVKYYEPTIRRSIEAHGLEETFATPKRGQAFIWAANLIHGGSARQDHALSRFSQVTHYYFEGCTFTTPMRKADGQPHIRSVYDISKRRFARQRRFPSLEVMAASRWRLFTQKILYS